jgi:uncharacterized protein (DUF1015 family)
MKQWFDMTALASEDANGQKTSRQIKEWLEQNGRTTSAIAFRHYSESRTYLFRLKPGMGNRLGEDLHPSLKQLDVLVLSRLVLRKALGFGREDMDNEEIFHYESDMGKALSLIASEAYQMAFLLNPTKIEHVKEVASNALVMPRKSTYFYPKILTGLVFNKIDPHDFIKVP